MNAPFQLKVRHCGKYLHIVVEGENTAETVKAYLAEVRAKCIEAQCASVLVEENLRGSGLELGTIFQIVDKASREAAPAVRKMAFVDVNPEHKREAMEFAETTAVNRGVNVRVFPTVFEAELWLTG